MEGESSVGWSGEFVEGLDETMPILSREDDGHLAHSANPSELLDAACLIPEVNLKGDALEQQTPADGRNHISMRISKSEQGRGHASELPDTNKETPIVGRRSGLRNRKLHQVHPPLEPVPSGHPILHPNAKWGFKLVDRLGHVTLPMSQNELLMDDIEQAMKSLPLDSNMKLVGAMKIKYTGDNGHPWVMPIEDAAKLLADLPDITYCFKYNVRPESGVLEIGMDREICKAPIPVKQFILNLKDATTELKLGPLRQLFDEIGSEKFHQMLYKTDLQVHQHLPSKLLTFASPLTLLGPLNGLNTHQVLIGSKWTYSSTHIEDGAVHSENTLIFGMKLWNFYLDVDNKLNAQEMYKKLTSIVRDTMKTNLDKSARRNWWDQSPCGPTVYDINSNHFMAEKCFLLHPDLLLRHGIRVIHTIQRRSETVVTSPFVFHTVVNLERTAAIAVNFTTPSSRFFPQKGSCKDNSFFRMMRDNKSLYDDFYHLSSCPHHSLQLPTQPTKSLRTMTRDEQLIAAKEHGMPVVIDFTAETSVGTKRVARSNTYDTNILGFVEQIDENRVIVKSAARSSTVPNQWDESSGWIRARQPAAVFINTDEYEHNRKQKEEQTNEKADQCDWLRMHPVPGKVTQLVPTDRDWEQAALRFRMNEEHEDRYEVDEDEKSYLDRILKAIPDLQLPAKSSTEPSPVVQIEDDFTQDDHHDDQQSETPPSTPVIAAHKATPSESTTPRRNMTCDEIRRLDPRIPIPSFIADDVKLMNIIGVNGFSNKQCSVKCVYRVFSDAGVSSSITGISMGANKRFQSPVAVSFKNYKEAAALLLRFKDDNGDKIAVGEHCGVPILIRRARHDKRHIERMPRKGRHTNRGNHPDPQPPFSQNQRFRMNRSTTDHRMPPPNQYITNDNRIIYNIRSTKKVKLSNQHQRGG